VNGSHERSERVAWGVVPAFRGGQASDCSVAVWGTLSWRWRHAADGESDAGRRRTRAAHWARLPSVIVFGGHRDEPAVHRAAVFAPRPHRVQVDDGEACAARLADFWAGGDIVLVTYVLLVMRADNDGARAGIMALITLIRRNSAPKRTGGRWWCGRCSRVRRRFAVLGDSMSPRR